MRGRLQIPGGYGVPEERGKFATTVAGFLRLGMGRVPVFVSNPILANTNPQTQIAPDRWGRVGPLGDAFPSSGLIVNYIEPILATVGAAVPVGIGAGNGLSGSRAAAASYDPNGSGYATAPGNSGGGGTTPGGSSASRNAWGGGGAGGGTSYTPPGGGGIGVSGGGCGDPSGTACKPAGGG